MKQLTKAEDQIMQIVWRLKTGFIRDIIEEMPLPKPHYNTIATIVKILVKKGYLQSELMGNTHQYRAAIDFEEYRETYLGTIKKNYFGNSFPKMIAHFAKQENLTQQQLDEMIQLIKSQNK